MERKVDFCIRMSSHCDLASRYQRFVHIVSFKSWFLSSSLRFVRFNYAFLSTASLSLDVTSLASRQSLLWRVRRAKAVSRNLPLPIFFLHHKQFLVTLLALSTALQSLLNTRRSGSRESPTVRERHDLDDVELHCQLDGLEDLVVARADVVDAADGRDMLGHEDGVGGVMLEHFFGIGVSQGGEVAM